MTELPNVDIDSVEGCPTGGACEVCGWTDGCVPPPLDGCPIVVGRATCSTPVGVLCIVICNYCQARGEVPKLRSFADAIGRVCEHCVHLGIDVDQMAALIDAEQGSTNLDPYAAGDGHPLFGGPL